MNRQQRRAQAKLSIEFNKSRPEKLTPIPRDRWPLYEFPPTECWESNQFCVQQFNRGKLAGIQEYRLSICRTTLGNDGRWIDGISWDELMQVKRDIGYGDWYGVEIYPRDKDIVNVANMRHLWIFERPLNIGWFKP